MHRVVLSESATNDYRRLAPAQRSRALKVMRRMEEEDSAELVSMRVRSSLLNTTLFIIRRAGLRLIYEIARGRKIVLTIEGTKSKC